MSNATLADGSIVITVYGTPAEIDRFWSKVVVGNTDVCWEWKAARDKGDYGTFWFRGRQQRALRVAWQLTNNQPIPPGLVVRHVCDNPPCTNPAHLLLGTTRDNDADRVTRGRSATGDRNGSRLYPERLVRGDANALYRPDECRNGHPLSRRYVSASGERRCSDCQAERQRRHRAKGRHGGAAT